MFEAMGHQPVFYHLGARDRDPEPFLYPQFVTQRISAQRAVKLVQNEPSLLVYVFWKQRGRYVEPLMRAGLPYYLTDRVELYPDLLQLLKELGHAVHTSRESIAHTIKHELGLRPYLAPLPYVPVPDLPATYPHHHARAMTRIDFRKHVDEILAANASLPDHLRVRLCGEETNRMLVHHILDKKFPDWRTHYDGPYPLELGHTTAMARRSCWSIDLTHFRDERDAPQYIHFETWQAGTPLILHKKWHGPRMDDAALFVDGPGDLARVLKEYSCQHQGGELGPVDRVVAGGYRMLKEHSPQALIEQYMEAAQRRG
jgi:hypothetical protein